MTYPSPNPPNKPQKPSKIFQGYVRRNYLNWAVFAMLLLWVVFFVRWCNHQSSPI